MRKLLLLLTVGLGLACGPSGGGGGGGVPPAACNPTNCEGCCAGSRCLLGNQKTACGNSGETCQDCGSGTCDDHQCTPPSDRLPIAQGSCESPPRASLDAGYEGTTERYASHRTGTCASADTSDFVVGLDVTAGRHVRVVVTPLDADFRPAISVHGACSPPSSFSGLDYGCKAAPDAGLAVALGFDTSAFDSTYFLVVDGADNSDGRFRVELQQPGESCAQPLTVSTETLRASGTTSGANNDSSGSCGGGGPDVVTEITVAVRSNLVATMPGPTNSSTPVLYLQQSCGGEEVACSRALSSGSKHALEVHDLAPGTYYLWADDDLQGSAGELSVALTPVLAGDTCANPTQLQFTAGADGGTAQVNYNAFVLKSNGALSCGNQANRDAVFTFTTARTFDFVATLDSFYELALRGPTCEGQELICANKNVRISALPAGTWYLWAHGASTSARLDVSLSDPKPGDSCFNPKPLPFTGGADGGDAFVQASLLGYADDAKFSCGLSGDFDEVYQFTTNQVLDFRGTATAATYAPRFTLRASCEADELGCGAFVSSAESNLAVGTLAPGTYFLWVESVSVEPYSLAVSLTPPVPTDTCLSPGTLTLATPADGGTLPSASATGNTAPLFHNSFGSCGGSGSEDAVYAFTLASAATVTARVAGSGGLRPVVYLRDACDATERACAIAPAVNGTATATASLSAGTHYVWVDGLGATAGTFSLEVSAQ